MTAEQKSPSIKPRTAVAQQTTNQSPGQRSATAIALPRPQAVLQRAEADPMSLTPAEVDVLQRTIGLRAAQRMLGIPSPFAAGSPFVASIQAKLMVGPVGDKYEQEADRVARQIVRGMTAPVQRHDLDEENLQAKPNHGMEGGDVDTDVARSIQSAKGGGAPLHDGVRSSMEQGFGADFSGVRVHTDGQADTLNRSLNARAFTAGNDIFFGEGEYNPGSTAGRELLAHELTHTVQQGAAPVQRQAEQSHGMGCTCSACGRATVQRVATHAAGCGCAVCVGGVVQRHLDEAEVQAKPLQRQTIRLERTPAQPALAAHVPLATHRQIIQRHSSNEHKLLGDADPTQLGKIGAWKNFVSPSSADTATIDLQEGSIEIERTDVLHLLEQEISRLNEWQNNPPKGHSSGQTDPTYGVLLVTLPGDPENSIPDLTMTYGELNTMGDYFGSVEGMKEADRARLEQVLQSVRIETRDMLMGIHEKIRGSNPAFAEKEGVTKANAGAYGNDAMVASTISSSAGQVELMKLKGSGAKGAENTHTLALARNACHFAPESWHTWKGYHDTALGLALQSKQKRDEALPQEGQNPLPEKQVETIKAEADRLLNEALLANGFGEHFLQDSYAAGHLINKTQIMKWFVMYIDTRKRAGDITATKSHSNSAAEWRRVQAISYGQPGVGGSGQYNMSEEGQLDEGSHAKDPQSALNRSKGKDMDMVMESHGLRIPPSIATPNSEGSKLLKAWIGWPHATNVDRNKISFADLSRVKGLLPAVGGLAGLKRALRSLIGDSVVYVDKTSWFNPFDDPHEESASILSAQKGDLEFRDGRLVVREEYLNFVRSNPQKKAVSAQDQAIVDVYPPEIMKRLQNVTYEDYIEFLSRSFVQKSTNELHNYFCENGLTVKARNGTNLGKIYGDDHMLDYASSRGVEYSSTTSHWSRDAVRYAAGITTDGDTPVPDHTTEEILARFPYTVVLPDGAGEKSLEEWHSEGTLKKLCDDTVFPIVAGSFISNRAGNFDFSKQDILPHQPF
jgi:hypothetical protein